LFGVNYGTIRDVQLANVVITVKPNAGLMNQSVGALAGQNFGSIRNAAVLNGTIDGGNAMNVALGGLGGYNAPGAAAAGSFAQNVHVGSTAAVNGGGPDCGTTNSCQYVNAGGLVGQNQGTISGFAGASPLVLTNATETNVATGCAGCLTGASGTVSVGSG